MVDLIVAWLNALSSGQTADLTSLLKTPEDYNATLYNATVLIHSTAVKPVTSIVLAIVASMMLATNSARVEGDRELGTRIIAATMFKIAMVFIVCQNAVIILSAIAQIASWMATTAYGVDVGAGGGANGQLGDQMRAAIDDAGTMNQLVMILVLILPWIVTALGTVIVIVLIFIRFLQMYLMGAFASLPVAFLGHEDTKQIGIGYLKRYAVVAISGVVIVLTIKLYQALLAGWLGEGGAGRVAWDGGDVLPFLAGNFGQFLIAPIVLIFLMFGANGIAKAIVGEG